MKPQNFKELQTERLNLKPLVATFDFAKELPELQFIDIQECRIKDFSGLLQNKALRSFTVKATVPPTLASNAFRSTNSAFTIYVPSQSVLAYQTADGWMNYASRITAIP